MLKNKVKYFPAISVGSHITALKNNVKHMKNDKSFRYYNKEDSIFYYDNLLVSAGHQYKYLEFKNEIGFNFHDNKILLGDSGGFQFATGAVEFTTERRNQIFNWLENNTNYAMNIDIPPYLSHELKKAKNYQENLNLSIDNFKYFEKNQTGKTKYMNILHGRNPEDLELWYNSVKNFNFTGGWGIGSVSINIYYILQSFFFLLEKGEIQKSHGLKHLIHFLGFSKNEKLYVILYLQQKLNEYNYDVTLSFDSSSPFLASSFGRYILFIKKEGMSNISFSNNILKENETLNKIADLPCNCPTCNELTIGDLFSLTNLKNGFKSEFYYYLNNHNLYKYLEFKNIMENIIDMKNLSIGEGLWTTKDIKLFKIIDLIFENKKPFQTFLKFKDEITINLNEEDIGKKSLF